MQRRLDRAQPGAERDALSHYHDAASPGASRGCLLKKPTDARRHSAAFSGLAIVDLATGEWLRLDGAVREIFDVAVLPDVMRPMMLGFVTPEIQQLVSIDAG